MKLLKTAFLATAIAAMAATQSQAQITIVPENDQFSLKLIGRTNLDAGTYFNRTDDSDHPNNAIAVNDTRLGVSGKFLEKWDYKIEICFQKEKISFRDVFVKYNFNKNHHIQAGNFFMPFGLKPLGLAYKFISNSTIDDAFTPARKMGIAYLLTTDPFNFTGGVFSNGDIDLGSGQTDAGLDLAAKAIYRPIINETTVLHFGVAAMYTNSEYVKDKKRRPAIKGSVPETFLGMSMYNNEILNDAHHYSTYEAELIFIHGKFLLESHFQGSGHEPAGTSDRYHMGGFLAQTSFLLIGEQQNYNKVTGLCQNASPRNLELLARYDYLDLHDAGNQSDLTIGLNYFFSKHFNMKLNYGVTQEHHGDAHRTYNTLQLRGQFSF